MHRIRRDFVIAGSLVWIALGSPFSEAQYTADFQTNLISAVTSNWSGTYYIGNTFSADVLLIQGNGVLTDGGVYLGYSLTSSNNSAIVTDSGSIWNNNFLYVGYNGFGNSLVVSNGAQVLDATYGWLGAGGVSRFGGNTATVTGSGSVWSNGLDLAVGYPLAGNRLVVNNGGLLINNRALVGSYAAASSNNSLLISDAGSVWTNNGDLYIGDYGASNSVTVSNGGKVFSGYGYVGNQIGASNNSLLVTGPGSLWTNRNDLNIGYSGAGNSLAILNSGGVYSSYGYIGNNATATGNSATVAGTGSVWSTVNSLYVGDSGAGNSLVISNRGRVATLFNDIYVGYNISGSNNSVLVSDTGTVWSNRYSLYIGYYGAGNSLVISNGGKVVSSAGVVGPNPSSKNNRVLVTGTGSVWSNTDGSLNIGSPSANNSLVISHGGQVVNNFAYVGTDSFGSTNNSIVVSGTGSAWKNNSDMTIGGSGWSNNLVISNGGLVVDNSGYLGNSGGSKNRALVTDTGSVWSNANTLYVGDVGANNSLVIQSNGCVLNADAYIGDYFSSSNNNVRVTSGGLWWNNSVSVGNGSSSNSVLVAGGTVLAANLTIGLASGPCDNFVEVDSGSLYVTNATGDAVLDVRYGTLVLKGGTLQVDTMVMTNACGLFVPQGGTLLYNQLVLDPNLSALGDGIPNGWKQQYGLDPLDPTLAGKDIDGTGFTVLQDYLAGTDPTNPAAAFRITSIQPSGIDLLVTWTMGSGKTNALQATAGDPSGGYSTGGFTDIFAVTNTVGTTTNYLDTGAATNFPSRYYRVRLVP